MNHDPHYQLGHKTLWPDMEHEVIVSYRLMHSPTHHKLHDQLRVSFGRYGLRWKWDYDHTLSIYTVYFLSEEDKVKFILRWL